IFPPMSKKPFIIDEYVRWSDVDMAGIIFYGSYVRFFELAETELFRAAGLPYSILFDTFDIYLPRVAVHTEFHHPARLDDHLRVAAYFGRIGTKSITLNFDFLDISAGKLAAHGHLVLVCTDRKSLQSRPLPEGLVEKLRPFAMSVEEARAYLGVAPG
ncbi:MAG TPA: thioesterase family protein, partial [Gemmatimonadales bacterium]|nr:thioesterase family protein [Gemmatimonadales bacterium]